MSEISIEVIGVEPPCPRCKKTMENAEKASAKIKEKGININIKKLNITSREVVSRYGVLVSPALAVNGVVKIMGRIPSEEEVEKLIKEAIQ